MSASTPRIDTIEAQIVQLQLTGGGGGGGSGDGGFDLVAPLSTLQSLPREQGKIYYATDNDTVYTDDGSQLNPIISFQGATTSDIAEGTNLYFTDQRVSENPTVMANSAKEGLKSRTILSSITGFLDDGQSANLDIAGYNGYLLYKVNVSEACWVRIYTSESARSSDSSRSQSTDPLPGSGVLGEVIANGPGDVLFTPGIIGFSEEADSMIRVAVTNLSGSTDQISIELTAVQLEV